MEDVLRYLVIFALQSAAIYAIAASGLVVTYTTSGIFNFAHGAIGMVVAFAYWQVTVDWGWPVWAGLLLCLFLLGPAIGLALDAALMRHLAGASTVTTIVATIGLLVAFVFGAGIIWPQGTEVRSLPDFFPGESFTLLDVNISYHSAIALGTAILVALALRTLLFRSRLGVAMRAVVESRDLSALNGARPGRVSAMAWMLGSFLAGLAGILIAPQLAQFTPVALTLLVIQAYAAAMVGRLRSLPLTFVGALILAELENGLSLAEAKQWLGGFSEQIGSLASALPAIMLLVVLVVMREDRSALRPDVMRFRVPRPRMITVVATMAGLVLVAAAVSGLDLVSVGTQTELGKGLALGIIMLSLVLLTGWAGQVSLAQLAFGGIAALCAWKVGSVAGLAVGVLVAGAVGALVALPALRMRSLYLALTTMAFALLLEGAIYANNPIFESFVPFATNQASVQRPGLISGDTAFFIFLAAVFGLVAIGLTAVRNGHIGRRLSAMKDSPAACATLGLDLTVTKLGVFAVASALAGLGGGLLAMWKSTSVGGSEYTLLEGPLPGLPLVLVAVIGGVTSVIGALVGGVLFIGMPLVGRWYPALTNLMNMGPGLVGIALAKNPAGATAQVLDAIEEQRSDDGEDATEPELVPEHVGLGRPVTHDGVVARDDEVVALDDELGLSWGQLR